MGPANRGERRGTPADRPTIVAPPCSASRIPGSLAAQGHATSTTSSCRACSHMAVLRSPYPKARIVSIDTSAARARAGRGGGAHRRRSERAHGPHGAADRARACSVPPHPVLARGMVHAVGAARGRGGRAHDAGDRRGRGQPHRRRVRAAAGGFGCRSRAGARRAARPRRARQQRLLHGRRAGAATSTRRSPRPTSSVRLRHRQPAPGGDVAGAARRRWRTPSRWARASPSGSPPRARTARAPTWPNALGFPSTRSSLDRARRGRRLRQQGPAVPRGRAGRYLALQLGRPVKWVATRSEDFLTTVQGRDQVDDSELALRRDGTMLGLKVRVVANLGAYLHSSTAGPPQRMMAHGARLLSDPAPSHVEVVARVHQHGPHRAVSRRGAAGVGAEHRAAGGPGRAASWASTRSICGARTSSSRTSFPTARPSGVEYDSGDYEKSLDGSAAARPTTTS